MNEQETEQDVPFEEPAPVEPTPEEAEEGEQPQPDENEPHPDEAAYEASAERERELAAERQEEAASIETQKREQDKQRKALDKLAQHVAIRYQTILGDDLSGFIACELCSPTWPGIRLPIMPDPETLAKVKRAIGEDPDPPLHADNYARACDDCDGYGVTFSGSKLPAHAKLTCLTCAGRGWIPVGSERDPGHTPTPIPANGGAELAPVEGEPARTAEEETLRRQGAIVVWPPKPPTVPIA